MKKTIYFEIFGKKMKTTVDAINNSEAEKQVRDKIIIHKIIDVKESNTNIFGSDDTFNDLKDLMDILGLNKK